MLYAKSNPEESITEHTNELLKRLEKLENLYGYRITENKNLGMEFWNLIKISATYHDVGKVYTPFQNVILKSLGKEVVKTDFPSSITHEKLSPLFIPNEIIDNLSKDEYKIAVQSILYHHERENSDITKSVINEIIEKDIKPRLSELEEELKIELNKDPDCFYLKYYGREKRINSSDKNYIEYILTKGLLHRLDYSASAHLQIETEEKQNMSFYIKNKITPNELQNFCTNNSNKNMVIIASTGYGKTEAGLLWSSGNKTFFTLPMRISINSIYDRIINKYGYDEDCTGLLHSSALEYLENNNSNNENISENYIQYEESRLFSKRVTVCTIDQLFSFVFKYPGYEMMYATLSYSNLIIDEIQAYSPSLVAIIIKGLEMINKIGGKFLIMTATLPGIYKEKLQEKNIEFEYGEFLSQMPRHRAKLIDDEISKNIDYIIEKSENKKALIIVNTVKKAIELYEKIKEETSNVYLLHSRFIASDKANKEKEIVKFDGEGIWITTQIVEASLDIDFDILFTEMSTLDSLFQRFGRCYRKRALDFDDYNIYIYTKNCSGVKYIYDEEIFEKSIEILKKHDSQNILTENEKIKMVENLYSRSNLEGTKFLEKFDKSFEILDNIVDYDSSKKDAQKILRNIKNVKVIPSEIYDENINLIDEYINGNFKNKKLRKMIEDMVVNISYGQSLINNEVISKTRIKEIYRIDRKYDENIGLILEDKDDSDFRFL